MSERGVFAIDRGWFDHPAFAKEKFTEREAWAWIIAEAAWKPRRKRVGVAVVDLQRGQLAHSLRFMAMRWQWSKSKVDRFLIRLKTDTMVGTETGTGVLVITVCNYDAYQRVSLPSGTADGTPSGTAAGQQRDKLEDIKSIKDIRSKKEKDSPSIQSTNLPAVFSPESDFEIWWKQYPRKVDKGSARKAYARVLKDKRASADELMAGVLRYAAERQNEDQKFTKHPTTWLNAEGWLNESLPAARGGASRSVGTDAVLAGMRSHFEKGEVH